MIDVNSIKDLSHLYEKFNSKTFMWKLKNIFFLLRDVVLKMCIFILNFLAYKWETIKKCRGVQNKGVLKQTADIDWLWNLLPKQKETRSLKSNRHLFSPVSWVYLLKRAESKDLLSPLQFAWQPVIFSSFEFGMEETSFDLSPPRPRLARLTGNRPTFPPDLGPPGHPVSPRPSSCLLLKDTGALQTQALMPRQLPGRGARRGRVPAPVMPPARPLLACRRGEWVPFPPRPGGGVCRLAFRLRLSTGRTPAFPIPSSPPFPSHERTFILHTWPSGILNVYTCRALVLADFGRKPCFHTWHVNQNHFFRLLPSTFLFRLHSDTNKSMKKNHKM